MSGEPGYQIRSYEIAGGEVDTFLGVFPAVVAARRAVGFDVVGAWVDEAAGTFVWIVGYDGEDGFAAASDRYYASPERAAITPDPGSLLTSVDTRMMRRVV